MARQKDNPFLVIQRGRPHEQENIIPLQRTTETQRVFNFHLYKSITAKQEGNIEKWETKKDIYGLSYLEDEKSNKAWFQNDEHFFYFIRYDGSKHSLLYAFFISCYKIAFDNRQQWILEEPISVSYLRYSIKHFIQDIIASFHLIFKAKYSIKNSHTQDNRNALSAMESNICSKFKNKEKTEITSKITILDNYSLQLHITGPDKQTKEIEIKGELY